MYSFNSRIYSEKTDEIEWMNSIYLFNIYLILVFIYRKQTSYSKVFKLMADLEKQHFLHEKYNSVMTLMTSVCTEVIIFL